MQNAVQIVLLTSEQFNDLMAEVRAIRAELGANANPWRSSREICEERGITQGTLTQQVKQGLYERHGTGKSARYRMVTN